MVALADIDNAAKHLPARWGVYSCYTMVVVNGAWALYCRFQRPLQHQGGNPHHNLNDITLLAADQYHSGNQLAFALSAPAESL